MPALHVGQKPPENRESVFARFFHIAEKSGASAPVSKFCDLFVKKRHDDAAVVVVNEEFRALCHVARQVN